jgi:hypothetical protein
MINAEPAVEPVNLTREGARVIRALQTVRQATIPSLARLSGVNERTTRRWITFLESDGRVDRQPTRPPVFRWVGGDEDFLGMVEALLEGTPEAGWK